MFMKKRLIAAALTVLFLCASVVAGAPARAVGITVPTVAVSPNTAGVRAKYVIEFDITVALEQYQAITIQFVGPSLTVLPCTPCNQKIDQYHVLVNGINPLAGSHRQFGDRIDPGPDTGCTCRRVPMFRSCSTNRRASAIPLWSARTQQRSGPRLSLSG